MLCETRSSLILRQVVRIITTGPYMVHAPEENVILHIMHYNDKPMNRADARLRPSHVVL